MPRIPITHTEAVTPLGTCLADTWQALRSGATGIRKVERFTTHGCCSDYAAHVPGLQAPVNASLLHALLAPLLERMGSWPLSPDTRLFLASTKAGIDMLERTDAPRECRHPDLLPETFIRLVEQRLGLDPTHAECVSAACASGGAAIMRAGQSIALGHCHSALVVCADISSLFTFSGFSCLRALSPHPCRPFHEGRDGLTLGEGAAAILLMSEERALELDIHPKALLTGWGFHADARHITAPARDARGLIQALHRALTLSNTSVRDIAGVCAHGTGTVYNDAMELTAVHAVFPTPPPMFSAKGALGHSMAASGGIEAALCCEILRERFLPPTLGCDHPEEHATGLVSNQPQDIAPGALLSCNSGFGGSNVVLVLEKEYEEKTGEGRKG